MNRNRLIRHSVAAMGRYKLRSGFIMLGSFVGAAALTLVVSVGAAAERKMVETVRQLFGASSVMVVSGGSTLLGGSRSDAARLTLDDIEALAAELPQIASWDPQQALSNASVRHEGATATARVLGASERFAEVWQRDVSRGTLFDGADVRGAARVAVIGETVAAELFGGNDPIDGEILIGTVPFRVVGVLERFGTDLHGMDRDDEIVVPLTTLMRRVMNVDNIAAAKLVIADVSQVAMVSEDIRRVLRARHANRDDFTVMTTVQAQRMVARFQRVLALYLPLAAGIALVVGGIVAASLMLASVSHRTGEIGLRRAVGARIEDIQLQFVVETVATMLAGAALGVLVGLIGARIAASRLALSDTGSWQAIVLVLVATIVTGLLAGVLPARHAARLDPANALR